MAIRASFVERLYDQEAKCFSDANIDGVLSDKHGEQVNSAALYWQLCDDELGQSIINRLYVERAVRYTEAQPFFTSVVLRALNRMERTEIALQLIGERWGKRMVDRGAASTYEEWQLNGSWRKGTFGAVMRTQSHAWSAFPAEYFNRLLAGIEIVAPGCSVMRVAPRPAPFDYTAAFPTPLGTIKVENRGGKPTIEAPDAIQLQI
jgi:hypothetical protein